MYRAGFLRKEFRKTTTHGHLRHIDKTYLKQLSEPEHLKDRQLNTIIFF